MEGTNTQEEWLTRLPQEEGRNSDKNSELIQPPKDRGQSREGGLDPEAWLIPRLRDTPVRGRAGPS